MPRTIELGRRRAWRSSIFYIPPLSGLQRHRASRLSASSKSQSIITHHITSPAQVDTIRSTACCTRGTLEHVTRLFAPTIPLARARRVAFLACAAPHGPARCTVALAAPRRVQPCAYIVLAVARRREKLHARLRDMCLVGTVNGACSQRSSYRARAKV